MIYISVILSVWKMLALFLLLLLRSSSASGDFCDPNCECSSLPEISVQCNNAQIKVRISVSQLLEVFYSDYNCRQSPPLWILRYRACSWISTNWDRSARLHFSSIPTSYKLTSQTTNFNTFKTKPSRLRRFYRLWSWVTTAWVLWIIQLSTVWVV